MTHTNTHKHTVDGLLLIFISDIQTEKDTHTQKTSFVATQKKIVRYVAESLLFGLISLKGDKNKLQAKE